LKPLIVLYYHRILPFEGYDIDVNTFRWQLSFLKKQFDIVGPEVLYDLKKGKSLKRSSVLLTFDDGFLDNFVYAYPILKEFSAKALIFIITSKVRENGISKTIENSTDNLFMPAMEENALKRSLYKGDLSEFLSWDELKIMKDSGVFEIGSHSHNHVKVFNSDKKIGEYKIDSRVHWSYEFALGRKPKVGDPIYPMKSYLATRRFFKGKWEEKEDYLKRVEEDLKTSKELIKKHLGFDTPFFSWPWGEFSKKSLEIAKKVGFEFCFTTQKKAFFKDNFCMIGRIHAPKNKTAFVRKLLSNKYYLTAKIYAAMHK